jgi:hypothetical protein
MSLCTEGEGEDNDDDVNDIPSKRLKCWELNYRGEGAWRSIVSCLSCPWTKIEKYFIIIFVPWCTLRNFEILFCTLRYLEAEMGSVRFLIRIESAVTTIHKKEIQGIQGWGWKLCGGVWVKVVSWSRYKDKVNVFLDFLELPFCGWWLYLNWTELNRSVRFVAF